MGFRVAVVARHRVERTRIFRRFWSGSCIFMVNPRCEAMIHGVLAYRFPLLNLSSRLTDMGKREIP